MVHLYGPHVGQALGKSGIDGPALFGRVLIVDAREFGEDRDAPSDAFISSSCPFLKPARRKGGRGNNDRESILNGTIIG
jgi:hypothetical protein